MYICTGGKVIKMWQTNEKFPPYTGQEKCVTPRDKKSEGKMAYTERKRLRTHV